MAFTLTKNLITEEQQVRDGMCLADWEQAKGFDWSKIDSYIADPKLIPIPPLSLTSAGLKRIGIERPGDSPNQGGFGQLVPSPCPLAVAHWWGNPVGQVHDGIVAWLKAVVSQVSAHFVVSPGRVTQILPLTSPSWANGNSWANANSITFELDPNDINGTIRTFVELLSQLRGQGSLTTGFDLNGHQDYYQTACPGGYYPRLSEIRSAVDTGNYSQEDEMNNEQQATLDTAASKIDQVWKWMGGGTSATQFYMMQQKLAQLQATLTAQSAAVEALAKAQGVDPAEITRTVSDAVEAALHDVEITLSNKEA